MMISLYAAVPIVQDIILCGMDRSIRSIPMDCSCLCLLLVTLMDHDSSLSLHDPMNSLV